MRLLNSTVTSAQSLPLAAERAQYPTPFLLWTWTRSPLRSSSSIAYCRSVDVHYAMKCNPDPGVAASPRGRRRIVRDRRAWPSCGRCSLWACRPGSHLQQPGQDAQRTSAARSTPAYGGSHSTASTNSRSWPRTRPARRCMCGCAPRHRQPGAQRRASSVSIPTGRRADGARAESLGLVPCGIGFHVGSQMLDPYSWTAAIMQCGALMRTLDAVGIRIELLDLGGGFPARYADPTPTWPLSPRRSNPRSPSICPTRSPGSSSSPAAAWSPKRADGCDRHRHRDPRRHRWLHLDVGAFNGMMESLETQNALRYPITDSRSSPNRCRYHLTGPTCDSQDTLLVRRRTVRRPAPG